MVNASKQKVINYYNATQFDYWFGLGLYFHNGIHFGYWDDDTNNQFQAIRNLNQVLAQKANIKPGDNILDAGCGIGGSSVWLAQNYNINVTGITITPLQIVKAKKLAKKNKLSDRTRFLNQDYCNTDFADKSFNVVWGIESICYAQHKEDFIKEASRLLGSGGKIVIADGFLVKNQYTDKESREMQVWLDGWAVPNLAHYSEFANLLKKYGFEHIEYEDATPKVMKFSKWLHDRTKLFYSVGLFLQILGIRGEIEQNNMQAAMGQYECLKQGLWQYGIFTAHKL